MTTTRNLPITTVGDSVWTDHPKGSAQTVVEGKTVRSHYWPCRVPSGFSSTKQFGTEAEALAHRITAHREAVAKLDNFPSA